MSWIANLLGDATGGAVKNVLEGAGELAKDIRSAITGEISPEKKAELEEKAIQLENSLLNAQVQVNMAEAKHASVFVAGWRPMIGWVCGISLGAFFIPQYIFAAVLWVKHSWEAQAILPYPVDAKGLLELVLALLGMAGIRTVEKIKSVARN